MTDMSIAEGPAGSPEPQVQQAAPTYTKKFGVWARVALDAHKGFYQSSDDLERQKQAQIFNLAASELGAYANHIDPDVRKHAVGLLLSFAQDSSRAQEGAAGESGFVNDIRRYTGSAVGFVSPVGDPGGVVKDFVGGQVRPLTKGYWSGSDEFVDGFTDDEDEASDNSYYFLPREVQESKFDAEAYDRARFEYEVQTNPIQESEDGVRYVETSRGLFEIPTTVGGVNIEDKANEILYAQRGVDDVAVLGDRGIIGSLWYEFGSDAVEGYDRDIDVGGGVIYPFVPRVTGDFEKDRALLFSPEYRRALDEAAQGATGWSRAGLAAGTMASELVEYVMAGKLVDVAVGVYRHGVKFFGKVASPSLEKYKKLRGASIQKPAPGNSFIGSARNVKRVDGRPTWATLGSRDAVNEVALGIAQESAEKGTVNLDTVGSGILRGLDEIILERTFGVAGRGIKWTTGKALGRALGEGTSLGRGIDRYFKSRKMTDADTIMQEAARRVRATKGLDYSEARKQVLGEVRNAQVFDAIYDTAFISAGLGSYQVAMEQAMREGIDWGELSPVAKGKRIVGALTSGDSLPEVLGNFAVMGGSAGVGIIRQLRPSQVDELLGDPLFIKELNRALNKALNDAQDDPGSVVSATREAGDLTLGTREEMDKVAEEIDLINRSLDREQAVDLPSDELLHEATVRLMDVARRMSIESDSDAEVTSQELFDSVYALMHDSGGYVNSDILNRVVTEAEAEVFGKSGPELTGDVSQRPILSLAGLKDPIFRSGRQPDGVIEKPGLEAAQKWADDNEVRISSTKQLESIVDGIANGMPEDVAVAKLASFIKGRKTGVSKGQSRSMALDLYDQIASSEDVVARIASALRNSPVNRLIRAVDAASMVLPGRSRKLVASTAGNRFSEAADARQRAFEIIQTLGEGFANLDPHGVEARQMYSAILHKNKETEALFNRILGTAAGQASFAKARSALQRSVRQAQSGMLHLSRALGPKQYERVKAAMRAMEFQSRRKPMPKWLVSQLRSRKMLLESGDGYMLDPKAVESLIGDMQVWDVLAGYGGKAATLDMVDAFSRFALAEKPLDAALLNSLRGSFPEFSNPEIPLARKLDKFIASLNPVTWNDGKWMSFPIVNGLRNLWVDIGRAYGPFRTKQGREAGEASVRIHEATAANQVKFADAVQRIQLLVENYMRSVNYDKSHMKFATLLIERGTFKFVHNREDFTRRYEGMLGRNAGAMYDMLIEYVQTADEIGQDLVSLGYLTEGQYRRWRRQYIRKVSVPPVGGKVASQAEGPVELWPVNDQNLSRMPYEADARQLMDFSLLAPQSILKEAQQARLLETLWKGMTNRLKIIINTKKDDTPAYVLERDYQPMVSIPGMTPMRFGFYSRQMQSSDVFGSFIFQMKRQMEPKLDKDGEVIPDGEAITKLKEKLNIPPEEFSGFGNSDPSSPYFENTTYEPQGNENHGAAFPRTKQMERLVDSLTEYDIGLMERTARQGKPEFRSTVMVERHYFQKLDMLLEDYGRDPSSPGKGAALVSNAISDLIGTFRKSKTAFGPRHWIRNFLTSPVYNWMAGGPGLLELAMGKVAGVGSYAEANRMLALWSDSYNPETLAEFNGDREAYIKSLTPEGRAVLGRVESFLSLSGGATQSGAILNTESVDSLTKSFESGELTAEDFSSEIGHLTTAQQARFLQRFVQRLNLIDQGKELLMNSADAKAVALSIHKTLANYATVEYFFKLAAALHFEKTRRVSWDDATRMGARPTADYAGGSAVIQKWTTNWDQILPGTESAARKAMREQRDLGVLDLGNRALNGFGRLMFSNIFLMFQATAIPTHMYAAIRHPLRASASMAMLSSAAYYITQALAGEDEEERVLEATREMAGMDSWALLSKDQVDDIVNAFKGLVGDSTMSNGTFFSNDLPGVVRKLISTKPFQAVGAPERGRSTVIDLSDFSSPAMSFAMQMYEKGLHLRKGEGLRSLDRGAFFAGFLPEALVGTAHWARNFIMDRERTLYQKSVRAAKGLASQFAAGLHPMTRFASPDARMVLETFTGRSIYEISEGLPAMPYEQPTLGATTANFVMGMAARKGQVYSIKGSLAKFPEDKPTRLQRLVENVFGPVFTKKLSQDSVLEAKVKRATSASRANLERSFRAAYREHYYLEQAGIPQTFDNVLRRYFMFNRDVTEVGTYRDPGIRKDAVTPMGVFIRNAYEEDPEYGKYVQTATTRMVRDYIFKDKRYHALMEMSRRRLVDPSIAERMFSGLIDSSNYEIASLARETLVKRGDLKDLRAWYSVISRIPVDDMTGVLGKEAVTDLYRLFASHNMFDDIHAPDFEDLNKLFGSSMYDALPTQVILNLERR